MRGSIRAIRAMVAASASRAVLWLAERSFAGFSETQQRMLHHAWWR